MPKATTRKSVAGGNGLAHRGSPVRVVKYHPGASRIGRDRIREAVLAVVHARRGAERDACLQIQPGPAGDAMGTPADQAD